MTTVDQITASIPSFTVTPQINTSSFPEDIDQYNSEMPAVIAQQQLLTDQLQVMIPQINQVATEIDNASSAAVGAANYQGDWTSKGYSKGESVSIGTDIYTCKITHATAFSPPNATYWQPTGLGSVINSATTKTTPVNADKVGFWDSVSGALRGISWENIKAALFNAPTVTSSLALNNGTSDTPNLILNDPINNTSVNVDMAGEQFRFYTSYRGGALKFPLTINTSDGSLGVNTSNTVTVGGASNTAQFAVWQDGGGLTNPVAGFGKSNDSVQSAGATMFMGRTRGTKLAPTAILDGDYLGSLVAVGWGASSGFQLGGRINFIASGTPSATSMPTDITVSTTPSGSITPVERLRVKSNGRVLLNTSTDNGVDALQVNGTVSFSTPTTSGQGATKGYADGVSSLATSGYQKLPSGLIIQWGVTANITAGGSNAITFPIAFTNAIFGVNATWKATGSGTNNGLVAPQVTLQSTAGATINNYDTDTGAPCFWVAYGY